MLSALCILGPLRLRGVSGDTALGGVKPRRLLAALALNANEVVSADTLADVVWGERPPRSVRQNLQTYVWSLRRALAAAGGPVIDARAPGYVLRAKPEDLDWLCFCRLAQAAGERLAGDPAGAAKLLREALGYWEGRVAADVADDLPAMRARIEAMEEARLGALQQRIEADIAVGTHRELAAELAELVAAHPLREQFRRQQMLVLYRSGRQADAFAAFHDLRARLADELGIGPGPAVRELYDAMLRADPGLDAPGAEAAGRADSAPQIPRQLPAAVADFTGRATELDALTRMLDEANDAPGTVVITAIGGTAGVGKTALALRWAHQVAHRFPAGQLHVNLRGFDPSGTPVTPEAAIRGFLDALGVPPERIPPLPDAQAGLYRSLLADKRMLIVLDNARDEEQVRPLLPASPGSLVIVTSRSQLSGLAAADGARLLSLDVLTHGEAVQLLTARIGHARGDSEPEAVSEIARLCACLPLALAVAAARAAARPTFALAALASELRDAAGRLDALDAGDPAASVRAVFSWSYQRLSPEAARMFRLLGLHPGLDISVPAAASLAGTGQIAARRILRELTGAHLIAEHVPGRYAFHDLLRAYAADKAGDADDGPDRSAAIGRVLDHYLHTAYYATGALNPAREPIALAPPRPGVSPEQLTGYQQAIAWFEAEHQVLVAAIGLAESTRFDRHAWQLPWAMSVFLVMRGHERERAATQRTALACATRIRHVEGQAVSSRLLAGALANLGVHDQALRHFMTSLELYRQLGNRVGEAMARQNLAVLAERQGRYADALGHAEQALRQFQDLGDKMREAQVLNAVGWLHGLLGSYQLAKGFCEQAVALSADVGYRRLEAYATDSLGYVEHHLGNYGEAALCCRRALKVAREIGESRLEATILTHLGDTRHAVGELSQAREAWEQALVIFEDMQHSGAAKVRAKLASVGG